MKYLKLFEDLNGKIVYKTEEEEIEDIEDALMIEGIFDEWTLLDKDFENTFFGIRYDFKLEPKKNPYLYKNEQDSKNFINEEFFDKQISDLFKKLCNSRLTKLGYNFKANWTYYHDGYHDNGDSKYKVDIWIIITRYNS